MVKAHPTVVAIGQNKGHPVTKFKVAEKIAKVLALPSVKASWEKEFGSFVK